MTLTVTLEQGTLNLTIESGTHSPDELFDQLGRLAWRFDNGWFLDETCQVRFLIELICVWAASIWSSTAWAIVIGSSSCCLRFLSCSRMVVVRACLAFFR